MTRRHLRQVAAPLGEADIPYHDLGGDGAPRAVLVAGLRGNEVNGVFVLARLAAYLGALGRGEQQGRLGGRTLIVPAVNVAGLHTSTRTWPVDNTDIDQMFPGNDRGETTQRIAYALLEMSKGSYFRIDVRGGSEGLEEVPHVRLVEPHDDERSTACQFGLPVVEALPEEAHGTSLYAAWRPWGGECFVLHAGLAGTLQLRHCERLFHAIVAFLHRTGILQDITLSEEDDLHYFGVDQRVTLRAERAGMFVSHLDVGRWVQAGETIGHVYDGFEGELRAEVRTPVSGLVSSRRRQPVTFEGDVLAQIQRPRSG